MIGGILIQGEIMYAVYSTCTSVMYIQVMYNLYLFIYLVLLHIAIKLVCSFILNHIVM
jgi:hypothetical protein